MENRFYATVRDCYFQFQTGEGVFSRNHLDSGTRLLAENMILPEEGDILDLGCGYGPLGIIATKLNPKLKGILTDNNSSALKLAKLNAKINHVANVEFRLGNVYSPVQSSKFSLILTNPPLSAGFSVVSEIIQGARTHLKQGGAVQLVVRKGFNMYAHECERAFGNLKVLARASGYRVFHAELTKT